MSFYPQDPYQLNQEDSYDTNPIGSPSFFDEYEHPEYIEKFRELPDGSAIFVAGEKADDVESSAGGEDFYENLAEYLDDSVLDGLAIELLEEIEEDKKSREAWEASVSTIIKYLGWDLEDYKDRMCKAYDNTLSTTLMNILAILKGELFPPNGPARGMALGYPTEDIVEKAERVSIFINYFLTIIDKVYYPDKEKMLLYVCLLGNAFTKVVMDPLLGRPSGRFIKPQDLIINNNCSSILESNRITQVIQMTRKEILLKERDGIYRRGVIKNSDDDDDEDFSEINRAVKRTEGISKGEYKNKNMFCFYESHVEIEPSRLKERHSSSRFYNDEEDLNNIPRPYIVEICVETKKIASIKRNWKPEDDKFKRVECFTHYYFLTGLGLYCIGLGSLLGSNAIVLTNTLRQTLDSISFGNFPGGFIKKGAYPEDNNLTIYPGEFKMLQTDDRPIGDIFQTLPYKDPSPISIQIRQELKADTTNLGGAAQQAEPIGGSNTPVGTILQQISVRDRIPSNILKSLISSLSYELQIFKQLFAEYFGNEPYPFNVPGNHYQIMKQDFSDNVNIVPVADPNLSTTTHRIIINEILVKIAKENPGLFDIREAFRRLLVSMKVDDLDKLMPKPQEIMPADPITENMAIMTGKGAKASIEQDHQSHMITHGLLIQSLSQDQSKQAELSVAKAHQAEHQALQYLVQMQMAMGMQMPDQQQLQNPQVQNQIAMMAAQATQQIQQQQQAENPPPIDSNVVLLKDIEQRRESSLLKMEEAKLRAETESFKTQTQFESDKLKMEVEKEVAKDKNETSLAIAKMKQKDSE